ncbi:MAG: hypothetical protein JNM66_14675 [Bryobacterales bacterium]|nr:hypothetical protein [Bryobacterales bacterium]
MNQKPELKVLGSASLLVQRNGNNGKASPGGDGQCSEQFNCSLSESDD